MASTQQQFHPRRRLMPPSVSSGHQLFWFHIFFSWMLWCSLPDVQSSLDHLFLDHTAREIPRQFRQIKGTNLPREKNELCSRRTVGEEDGHQVDLVAKFWRTQDYLQLESRESGALDHLKEDFPSYVKSDSGLPPKCFNEFLGKNYSKTDSDLNIVYTCPRILGDIVCLISSTGASPQLAYASSWPAYDGRGNLIGLLGGKVRSLLIPELPQDLDIASRLPCVRDLLQRAFQDERVLKLEKLSTGFELAASQRLCSRSKSLCSAVDCKTRLHSCWCVVSHKREVNCFLNSQTNSSTKNFVSRKFIPQVKPSPQRSNEQARITSQASPINVPLSHRLSQTTSSQIKRLTALQLSLLNFTISQNNSTLVKSSFLYSQESILVTNLRIFIRCSSQSLLPASERSSRRKNAPSTSSGPLESSARGAATPRMRVMMAAAQPPYTTEPHIFTGFTTTAPPPTPPPPDFSIVAKEECGRSFCPFLISYNKSFNFTRVTLEYREGDAANLTISLKLNITSGVVGDNFFSAKQPRRGFVYTLRGLSGRRRYYVCARGYPVSGARHGVKTSCESFMTSDTDGETDMYNLTGIFLVLGISTIIMTVVLLCVGYEKLIDRKKDECVDILMCRYKRKKTEKRPARGTISPEPLVVPHNSTRQAYDNDTVSLSSTEGRRY